ncbi:MAG: hypothetical protein J7518_01645 [Nocardioidaceae bacterium]|nr:hypothetical protein [Nocardioidaceae bacterium]
MRKHRRRADFAEVVTTLERLGGRRFAGLEAHPQEHRITTYWVGHPPKRVQELVGTRPHGIDIELVTTAAAYGEGAMRSAAVRVRRSLRATDLGVLRVSVSAAGTGLDIEVRDPASGPDLRTALAQIARLPLNAIHCVSREDRTPMA